MPFSTPFPISGRFSGCVLSVKSLVVTGLPLIFCEGEDGVAQPQQPSHHESDTNK